MATWPGGASLPAASPYSVTWVCDVATLRVGDTHRLGGPRRERAGDSFQEARREKSVPGGKRSGKALAGPEAHCRGPARVTWGAGVAAGPL